MKRAFVTAMSAVVFATSGAAQDQRFNSHGVQIRYVDMGTGEPVLLIHGLTMTVESNWIDTGVLPNLAKDHRVIAYDLRGHGQSDKPHDALAYRREFVQDAVRLLDHPEIDRAHIVGYSLGAQIVAKLLTTVQRTPDASPLDALGRYRRRDPCGRPRRCPSAGMCRRDSTVRRLAQIAIAEKSDGGVGKIRR